MVKPNLVLSGVLCLFLITLGQAAWSDTANPKENAESGDQSDYGALRSRFVRLYGETKPQIWGEHVPGVETRLKTRQKVVALTFDACGGPKGKGFDAKLIGFLERENIPATLFISGRWIEANPDIFRQLARNPLFEIANHGDQHRPASVSGRKAYGIQGTHSVGELVDEIELNARRIAAITGKRPAFYRSGTAYYDEIAVAVAGALGQQVAGYSVLGDAGATFDAEQVKNALLHAPAGAIVICHMNHPESGTAAGVMAAVPELKKSGITFVHLGDGPLE